MRPFRFRFQTILDAKKNQGRVLEIEVARLSRAIVEQTAARERWEHIKLQTLHHRRRARERADLADEAGCAEYLRHVRAQIKKRRTAVAELSRERECARRELLQLARSRKVLENYCDRLKAEFMAAQEKAEERVLDEFSVRNIVQVEGAP